ncbi:MAG: hypothetical protein PHD82_10065 [Candidatus Riflebacteria bacterium]|nr:hypothetical protein [Candidatus Riflebacteria bacterium]
MWFTLLLPGGGSCDIISFMAYYYIIPVCLTLLFAFSWGLVHTLLAIFDRLNFFWDWWDGQRRAFPILLGVEIAYFAAILYYIVYWELSGNV